MDDVYALGMEHGNDIGCRGDLVVQPQEFELGVSDSFEKSYSLAVDLAHQQKDDCYPAQRGEPKDFMGKVFVVTEHHVVQSLGRIAAIHEKRNLDRVPEKGEILTIAYDGKGPAKVEPKAQDKVMSR